MKKNSVQSKIQQQHFRRCMLILNYGTESSQSAPLMIVSSCTLRWRVLKLIIFVSFEEFFPELEQNMSSFRFLKTRISQVSSSV